MMWNLSVVGSCRTVVLDFRAFANIFISNYLFQFVNDRHGYSPQRYSLMLLPLQQPFSLLALHQLRLSILSCAWLCMVFHYLSQSATSGSQLSVSRPVASMSLLQTSLQHAINIFNFLLLQIIPRNLIFAHSAKVTALTKATDGWDNQSSIISAADNG